jgi:hypothetical protein
MKRIVWTVAMLAVAALSLLPSGCSKPASPPDAPAKALPAAKEEPTGPANSPNVVKAVGKALFKGFGGQTAEKRPQTPQP